MLLDFISTSSVFFLLRILLPTGSAALVVYLAGIDFTGAYGALLRELVMFLAKLFPSCPKLTLLVTLLAASEGFPEKGVGPVAALL